MNLVNTFNSHPMKSKNLLCLAVFSLILLSSINLFSQSSGYVKQVITANSGKFEFTPPYTDYVSLQTYNPATSIVNNFGTIFTQSAQSILISGHFAYVTAQDSVVKYNLNTLQRVAAVPDSGLNRMALYKNRLIISRQYPVSQHFLEVLDTANLSPVAEIMGISGDCGGVCVVNDTVYVAVNGGWMGTEGKLAIVDPGTWTVLTEVNFGPSAIGIWDLYTYQGSIFTVNKSPYGVLNAGSITMFNPLTRNFNNVVFPFRVAGGSGIKDNLLYFGVNYGIGSFDMNTLAVADTIIVPDPGSSVFTYIISSAVDTLDGRLYTNIGDYSNPGYCLVSSLSGDSLTSFPTGISSDAVAVDTRVYPVGIAGNNRTDLSAILYPNPVHGKLNIRFSGDIEIRSLRISDMSGRIMMEGKPVNSVSPMYEFQLPDLAQGLYYLMIETAEGRLVRSFSVIN